MLLERNYEYERCEAEGDVYCRPDARERELAFVASLTDEQAEAYFKPLEERWKREEEEYEAWLAR